MKAQLKALAQRLARTRPMRSLVGNLIYPHVADCIRDEVRPDVASPSGLAEALAWKTHAYLVLDEELRPTGVDCCADGMRCDAGTRLRLMEVVLARSGSVRGDVLEFGVYQGESLRAFAEQCPERHVYGFDSFEGLPEDWWTRPRGTFKTSMPQLDLPNLTLVPGWFDQSLPAFLERWPGRAAIVHVDCDLYQSTRTCLLGLVQRFQVGTVLLFDEYYNYPGFARHEWLAWREIRAHYRISAPCIAYDGRRAAFQVAELGQPAVDSPVAASAAQS